MGKLNTLAILVTLGATGQAAPAANPDTPTPEAQAPGSPAPAVVATPTPTAASPAPAKRKEPPVPPLKYLEAGTRLFNTGRYDLAVKYLGAANTYRDRLTSNEQVVLDVYLEKLDEYNREKAAALSAPPVSPAVAKTGADSEVVVASTAGTNPAAMPAGPVVEPAPTPAPAPVPARNTETWRDTSNTKQKARWALQRAREQTIRGEYDAAKRSVAEAEGYNIKWGRFDDTPAKVMEWVAKVQTNREKNKGLAAGATHDRRTAKALLREARAALAAGDVDKADQIAQDVKSWKIRFGLLDDTPDRVTEAVSEARQRNAFQSSALLLKSYTGPNASRASEPAPAPAPEAPAVVEPPAPVSPDEGLPAPR